MHRLMRLPGCKRNRPVVVEPVAIEPAPSDPAASIPVPGPTRTGPLLPNLLMLQTVPVIHTPIPTPAKAP